MKKSEVLQVIAFAGPSGTGKSTALRGLAKKYCVIQEKYMDLNRHSLDNRLFLSKWAYIHYWFDKVLEARAAGESLVLTDRCPLDTCAYVGATRRPSLISIVSVSMAELETRGIVVRTILAMAPFSVLQSRIERRLASEPLRRNYHEQSLSHNRRVYAFYRRYSRLWDSTVATATVRASEMPSLFEAAAMKLLNEKC
jgi:thymidylate kinase